MANGYNHLIDTVQERCGITYNQAQDVVYTIVGDIAHSLLEGEEVRLHGFGSFVLKQRAARTARNPRTGEILAVPPRKVITFKAASRLKSALQESVSDSD